MQNSYHHLTYEQRCQMDALLERGDTQQAIAKKLGISQSSVSRERKRNQEKSGYYYKKAY